MNIYDNPEPSHLLMEGVETGRRECIVCFNELIAKQRRFCSKKCTAKFHSYNWRVKRGLIKNPGVGSGGNQWGQNNHRYKNGIANFSKKAFDYYGKKCNRCSNVTNLLTHHKDHNRTNNDLSNLEVLCKKCHQMHHCNRCPITGKYIKGQSKP